MPLIANQYQQNGTKTIDFVLLPPPPATLQTIHCVNICEPYPSRANVGVSQISIPLAWNSDQHFKSKGETRVYSMFVVLQTKTRVIDSSTVTNVDRTMTDVVFPDSFIFEGEPDDFCIEMTLYAARTDPFLTDGNGGLRTRIARSLGKKFGSYVKSNLNTTEPYSLRGNCIGSTNYNLLARAYLVLTDAGDDCRIHDLRMSAFAGLSGPPLYGHVLCRLAVQPHSVLKPLAEGMITIKPLLGGLHLRNVRTRLQAGYLHCFTNQNFHQYPSTEETMLLVPITSKTRILYTSHPNTLLMSAKNSNEAEGYDFYITAQNYRAMQEWKRAIEMQIDDCAIWGDFAYRHTKLTFEKPVDPVKETLSRAKGKCLYDKIGTISCDRDMLKAPPSYYIQPSTNDAARTAPAKRNKQRANVLHYFEPDAYEIENRGKRSRHSPKMSREDKMGPRMSREDKMQDCTVEVTRL
ncbi:unnamed protein product [Cylicocyclus nassatus]|uniref:Anillin homology domain-containing protein n=1 Tax=Cylicocyclus nassatus TaxID=53992 RepID=A0AA36MBI1_CYLNA|nr:unnamed protein product [Cylicocyclus nassatus]